MKMVSPGYFGDAANPVDLEPVGGGPYKFISWEKGSQVVLGASGEYWQALQISYDEAALTYMLNVENIYGLSERLQWEPCLDGKVFVANMTVQ